MADRVVLHVGLPKTGTTYIQQVLWSNRDRLREAGIHLVAAQMRELFAAARDLVHGGEGEWRQLVDAVNRTSGTVVLSCEGFSAVPSDRVAAALAELGTASMRVICTLRDPTRVVPSVWQQHVRTGSTLDLPEFVRHAREGLALEWLPRVEDVLDTWSSGLERDQLHVVVVPPTIDDPDVLWQRFAAAAELNPASVEEVPPPANTSLPAAHVELLRRVNVALGDRLPTEPRRYRRLVRILQEPRRIPVDAPPPVRLDPPDHDWAATAARRTVSTLEARGHPVHGDLDELVPRSPQRGDEHLHGSAEMPSEAPDLAADLIANLLMALRTATRDFGLDAGRGARLRRSGPRQRG